MYTTFENTSPERGAYDVCCRGRRGAEFVVTPLWRRCAGIRLARCPTASAATWRIWRDRGSTNWRRHSTNPDWRRCVAMRLISAMFHEDRTPRRSRRRRRSPPSRPASRRRPFPSTKQRRHHRHRDQWVIITDRRLNLDLVTIYKIVHGLMDVDSRLLTVREESNTRGGALKIFKPQCQNNVTAHSFACLNVNTRNSLPEHFHFRCATTVAVFKRLINNYTFDVESWRGLSYFSVVVTVDVRF